MHYFIIITIKKSRLSNESSQIFDVGGLVGPSIHFLLILPLLSLLFFSRPFTSAARLSVSSTSTWRSWSTAFGTPECFIHAWTWKLERTCSWRAMCRTTGRASTSSTTQPSWATLWTFTRRWVFNHLRCDLDRGLDSTSRKMCPLCPIKQKLYLAYFQSV